MKKLTGVTATQAMAGNGNIAKVTPKKGKAAKKEVGSGTNTTPSKVTKRTPKKSKKEIMIEMPEEEDKEDEPVAESQVEVVKEEEYDNGEEQEEYASAEEEVDA